MCCPVFSEKTIYRIDELYDFLFKSSNLPWKGSSSESLVYRGIKDCNHELIPNLFRKDKLSVIYKNIYKNKINVFSGVDRIIEGRKAEYIVVSEFVLYTISDKYI